MDGSTDLSGQSEPPTPPSKPSGGKFKIAIEQQKQKPQAKTVDLSGGFGTGKPKTQSLENLPAPEKKSLEEKIEASNRPSVFDIGELRASAETELSATPAPIVDANTVYNEYANAPAFGDEAILSRDKDLKIQSNAADDDIANRYLSKQFNLGAENQEYEYGLYQSYKDKRDKGELNSAEERGYRNFIAKATRSLNEPYFNNIKALNAEADFASYWQGVSTIENSAEGQELINLDKTLKEAEKRGSKPTPEATAAYQQLKSSVDSKMNLLRDKTGVTPDIEQEYLANNSQIINFGEQQRSMRSKLPSVREESRASRSLEEQKQFELEHPVLGTVAEVAKGTTKTVVDMVSGILQAPRLFGNQEQGWTDEWASEVESALMNFENMGRLPTMEGEKLPFYLQGGRIFGEALGSMSTMAAGGGLAGSLARGLGSEAAMVNLATNAGVWSTTYLSQLDDNLQEGLDAGLTYAEAARNAHINSALSATVEMIVPEGILARQSFKELVKVGMKPALAAQQVVGDYAEGIIKETGEELGEQMVGDVARVFEDPRYEVADPRSYIESAVGAILLRGATGLLSGNKPSTTQVEQFKRDIAENPAAIITDMTEETDPTTGEVTDFGRAAQLGATLAELKQSEQFNNLDDVKQNHVLSIQDQITSLEALENPTLAEKAHLQRLESEKDELLNLGENGIDPKQVGIATRPQRVMTNDGQANFFINEDGDYEVEYNNGKSLIIDKGENAPRMLAELGLKTDDGESVGGTLENRNILLTNKIEKGANITYGGKSAVLNKVAEKNGNIIYANITTEDGRTLQIREGQKGDSQELLENLTRANKGEEQVFLTKEEVKEETQNDAESVKLNDSETDTKVKQENSNLTLEPETLITEETQTPTEAGVAQDETLVEAPLSESAVESEETNIEDVRLSEFKKNDVVTNFHNGKTYKIIKDNGGVWKLEDVESGAVTDWNADNNLGWSLRVPESEISLPENEPRANQAIPVPEKQTAEETPTQTEEAETEKKRPVKAEKTASGTVEESAKPSVEKAKSAVGEERETRRKRKRESLDDSPSAKKIKSLSNTYKSVDAEKVKELAEEEFSYFKEKIDKGEDVVDELINYSDSFNVPVGTEFGTQLASIGQNLLQKALLHYRLRVDSGFPQDEASLEKVEKHIEEFNRRAATAMALANPKVNADELGVVLNMIDDERKSVLNSPTKSGKTVGDIIEEIREEGVTKDEVAEVASSISIDNILKPSKSVSSKRKEQGLKKIKSGLSKLQSKSPVPLMALSPEKVDGIREIASGAVDLGIYGVEKITAYVKKQANKYVSEKDIQDTVEKYWKDGLEKMSSEGKMNEARENLVKALQSGNQKGILNSFANAILMQDPEYAAMSKKPTKGALDKVLAVLQNKEIAETVVNEAINYVVNESILNPSILNGLGLDKRDYVVSKSNPNGMTQEEFENFQRTVLQSNLKDLADTFLSSGVYETDLKDKRSTERKKNPTTESVQSLVKEFYSNPNINNEVLEQRLVDKLDISPEEAAKISQTVRDLLHRKIGKRSQSKIRGLINDLITNKSSDIQNVVARAMVTKGALNSRAFQNELIQYLGGKGMTSQDISKVIALANLYNSAPNNIVKNQYGVQMQNIIVKYNQSQGSLAFNFFLQNAMRGILGNPRTSIVTGSLSMLKTVPFDRLRQWIYRPSTAMRARQYRKEMRKRGYSLGLSGARAIMNGEKHIQNRIEPDAINAFRRDSEWQRVRESAWSDLFKAIKTKDKGARTNLLLKSIQSITFMGSEWNRTIKGKKYELSPIVRLYNLMSAADLFAWTGITNFNTYYNAERQALLEGLKFGSKEFSERMGQLILTDPQIFNEIEKLAKDEAAQLAASGQPVPKTYVADRKKQLYREHIDNDIFNQASFEAEKSMLLNKPSTFIGASVQKWLNEWSAIKDDQSVAKSAMKLSFGSLFLFSRVGMNVISRRGKNIPVYNIATAIFPFEYEARDGKVIKRTKEDGSVRNRMKDQPREYAMGILSAATRTALVIALFDMMFDYDEEKDEKGNPITDSDGNPIRTWKLNTSSPIQFHGDKEDLTRNQKRIAPAKCVEFTWVDDIDKRYWKFEWFPESWYTTLYMLGDKSDELRYVKDKQETAIDKKGNIVERVKERDAFKPHNIFTSAAFGAFDASFMSIVQGVKNVKRQTDQNNYLDASLAVGDKLLIQPLSSVVSPRFAEQVSQSASYFKERNKAYVQLSVKNKNFSEGIGKIAEYAVTQTWLGELLTDTKDENIIMHDAHGYEVKYSPNDIMFIPALVSDDINFEWANHVSKHKVYELYLNEKGKFDESVLSPPNSLSFGSISVTEDVRNKVKLEAQKKYGKALESQFDGLKKSSINERASIMKYLWKYSVYEAKTEAGFSPDEPKWEDDTE